MKIFSPDITGSLTVTGSTFISSSNATQFQVGNGLLFISSSGNVGIGTNSPANRLDVRRGSHGEIAQFYGNSITGMVIGSDTNVGYFSTSTSGASLGFGINGSYSEFFINRTTKNIGIGGATDPTARLHIVGAGATSATNALYVENSANTNLLTLKNNGSLNINVSDTAGIHKFGTIVDSSLGISITPGYSYGTLDSIELSSGTTIFSQNNASLGHLGVTQGGMNIYSTNSPYLTYDLYGIWGVAPSWGMRVADAYPLYFTTGDYNHIFEISTFSPSSGTCTFAGLRLYPTINQTGTATGITRGLYITPILTNAASFRSVEWNNNSGFGLYGSGSAANVLLGNTTIGTLNTGSATFNVSGSSDFKGNVTTTGSLNVSSNSLTVNIDSTNNNWVGVNTATSASYTKNFPLVVKGNNASDPYATIALVNDQPLIKWKGTYNSSNGAELYQNGSGTFLLNTNSNTSGFTIYSDGSPAFALYASTKMVVGDTVTPSSALGKLHIRGGGATSATNTLYVENSGGTQALTVRDDGAIIIGETATNLSIDPVNGRIIYSNPNSNGLIGFASYNTFLTPIGVQFYGWSGIAGGVNALGDLRFYGTITNQTYMYISNTGKIGINKGTVIPNAELDVSGSVIISGSLTISGSFRINNQTASAPISSSGGSPTTYYGSGGTKYLSDPATWLKINLDGTDYYIPAYS